jgi:hypothetical protein
MSQTKMLAMMAGAALCLGTAVAQTSTVDRAVDAERLNSTLNRTNLQGGGDAATLKVGGLIQFRYHANWRSDGTSTQPAGTITKDDDFTSGFANGKTKLWVKGTAAENLDYGIQGDFSTSSGGFNLDDAFFRYSFSNNFAVKAGQFKLPILREESISDAYQLAAQRSVVNAVFTQGRSQGVQAEFTQDNFRAMVAFSDGIRTRNTDWNSSSEADWALTGRVDGLIAGDWKRFDDFTSFKGDAYASMIGGAIHYQGGQNTGDGNDSGANNFTANFLLYTIDAQFEGDGWNVSAAFVGSNTDPEAAGDESTSAYGLNVQGGVFVDNSWEIFGRWDAIFADSNADGATNLDPDNFHFITAGVNYYLIPKKHTMKATFSVIVALNETYDLNNFNVLAGTGGTAPAGTGTVLPYTAGGILGDIDSGEIGLSAQVQVLF